MIRLWFLLLMTFAAAVAHADTPAFDRPGIAFSPSTLPAGTFDWEQGLPDVTRTDGNGTRSTLFSADTLVRIGLTPLLEVQLSSAPINHLRSDSGNATTSATSATEKVPTSTAPMPRTSASGCHWVSVKKLQP